MQTQATKRALAEEIKREILMDLQRSQNLYPYAITGQKQVYAGPDFIESIKREVLMELDRAFVETTKQDVMALIQADMRMYPRDQNPYQAERSLIEAVKQDVLAQIEAQQETQEELYAQQQTQQSLRSPSGSSFHRQNYNLPPDPALIQAVKNSVLADMQMPL